MHVPILLYYSEERAKDTAETYNLYPALLLRWKNMTYLFSFRVLQRERIRKIIDRTHPVNGNIFIKYGNLYLPISPEKTPSGQNIQKPPSIKGKLLREVNTPTGVSRGHIMLFTRYNLIDPSRWHLRLIGSNCVEIITTAMDTT